MGNKADIDIASRHCYVDSNIVKKILNLSSFMVNYITPKRKTDSIPTINQLITDQASYYSNKPALISIDNQELTYHDLEQQINYVASKLSELGITSEDRVATIMPNDLEMAVMFLGITKSAICCPLNPNYRASELEFYFIDLQIKALVTLDQRFSTAVEVAQKLNISVINLVPDNQKKGAFILNSSQSKLNFDDKSDQAINPDRIALILHTSGTTSQPKQVPLTHRNLCTSAKNISQALQLQEDDRCLNFMPFFHVHGLVITLLSSLNTGSSIICVPEFNLNQFWSWLEIFRPTWYSGVSTIHTAILQDARNNHRIINHSTLRFIRTSSAPIPPEAIIELESIFNIPVIQGYGMTEGSPQLAINPLPPDQRKPESVGLPCGVKIGIMDAEGNFLPPMKIGEVVINNIYFDGYLGDPSINQQAFYDGWFRTGDLGYLDEEGYLFLKGRIKEIINRGGEKIMPLEVDMVAMKLPEIHQAVTFPVPHPTLGEDIAIAVVLEPNQTITPQAIREYLSEKLVSFKVPHRVIIVEELPKGATKKLQRTAVANQLANSLINSEKIAPRNELEQKIQSIWEKVFNISPIGVTDDFYALGGDSILAVSLFVEINKVFSLENPSQFFLNLATVEKLAQELNQFEQFKEDDLIQPAIKSIKKYLRESKRKIKSLTTQTSFLDLLDYGARQKLHRGVVEILYKHDQKFHKFQIRRRNVIAQCIEDLGLVDPKKEIVKHSLFSNCSWAVNELSKDRIFEKWVVFEGLDVVDKLQASNPGIIFVTGHFIGLRTATLIQKKFEFTNYVHINYRDAQALTETMLDINNLYEPQKSLHEQTQKMLTYFLYDSLKVLEKGGSVYIAGDGYNGKNELFIPFHGRQRPFYKGFAELSLISGKPALPIFTSLELNGLIKVKIGQPIIAQGKTQEQKVLSMVQQYVDLLQQWWLDNLASVSFPQLRKFLNLPKVS